MGLGQDVKSLFMSHSGGTLGTRRFRVASIPTAGGAFLPIFTVSNGLVLMTLLVGETTVAEATGATNLTLQTNPTAGAAVALCIATAVTLDAIGTLYTITGNPADAVYAGLAVQGGMSGGALATGQNTHGWVIPPGTVDWSETVAAPTHQVQWTMFYVPIDPKASVAAA